MTITELVSAQERYCEKKGLPMFMPDDGYCFFCGADISEYIDSEQAGNHLITYCPRCKRSWCD